jgi:hypothetical protein
MGLQFMLFAAINMGIEILTERQKGIWKRLRSAPLSKLQLLGSKIASGTIIGSLVLLVSFGFAIVVWRVRVDGSVPGFLGVSIASALMAASYGLLVASLGKTPERRARRVGPRHTADGDARRRLGADVRVSGMASETDRGGAHAVGRGRLRRNHMARSGVQLRR